MSDNNGFQIPPEYRPISTWGYFGYELLFGIPFVGLILLIVFSFAPANINLKHFARSHFCTLFLCLIIFGIIFLIASFTVGTAGLAQMLEQLF